jgi:endonuclease-3
LKESPFQQIIESLEAHYGKTPFPGVTDPLGLILLETVAYLATDAQREAAFAALKEKVGLKPTQILAASNEDLIRVTRLGGIHPELRAARLKEIAQIVLNDFDGNLSKTLELPPVEAIKALKRFPSIGKPGAEKVLLFSKTYPLLALESNGLRVLLRLGFGDEGRNYSASYASVQEELKDQTPNDCDYLIRAHQLLRQHGKTLCRNSNPACDICPVNARCEYYRNKSGSARQRARVKRPAL